MEETEIIKLSLGEAYNYLQMMALKQPELQIHIAKATTGMKQKFHIGYLLDKNLTKYVYVTGRIISIRKEQDMTPEEYFEEIETRKAYIKQAIIDNQPEEGHTKSRY